MSKSSTAIRRYSSQLLLGTAAMIPILCNSSLLAQRCPKAGEKPGYFSKMAVVVCEAGPTSNMHFQMRSPDGEKLLVAEWGKESGNSLSIWRMLAYECSLCDLETADEVLVLAIKELAITTCFGANGPCRADTTLDDERISPFKIVQKTFAAGHEGDECYMWANVGALAWEDGSGKIVLIAQVPTANCDGHNGGYFEACVRRFAIGRKANIPVKYAGYNSPLAQRFRQRASRQHCPRSEERQNSEQLAHSRLAASPAGNL